MNKPADISVRSYANPPGFEISWAGANPFGDGYCFGSESGLLQFMDKDIKPMGPVLKASLSGEAINSVVGIGTWFAVSTRQEIAFFGKATKGAKPEVRHMPFGAYHLACTASRFFVAALGRAGLMLADGDISKDEITVISPGSDNEMFAYRLLTLVGDGRNEIIVCAGRSGGILFCQWHPTQSATNMQSMVFSNLDVIDVCSIGNLSKPRAIAGASVDGSIILSKDVLNEKKPSTIKFKSLPGVVYRLVQCRGHLFALTSEGLFCLWKLAQDFTAGNNEKTRFETPILAIPMKAIDVNVVMNRFLAVVKIDGIDIIDVDSIAGPASTVNHAKTNQIKAAMQRRRPEKGVRTLFQKPVLTPFPLSPGPYQDPFSKTGFDTFTRIKSLTFATSP